jgi:hypothetical protein
MRRPILFAKGAKDGAPANHSWAVDSRFLTGLSARFGMIKILGSLPKNGKDLDFLVLHRGTVTVDTAILQTNP